jgi:hypothetical protein
MTSESPERPHFEPNQVLTATALNSLGDFAAEQSRLVMRSLGMTNCVNGLQWSFENGELFISPGTIVFLTGEVVEISQRTFKSIDNDGYLSESQTGSAILEPKEDRLPIEVIISRKVAPSKASKGNSCGVKEAAHYETEVKFKLYNSNAANSWRLEKNLQEKIKPFTVGKIMGQLNLTLSNIATITSNAFNLVKNQRNHILECINEAKQSSAGTLLAEICRFENITKSFHSSSVAVRDIDIAFLGDLSIDLFRFGTAFFSMLAEITEILNERIEDVNASVAGLSSGDNTTILKVHRRKSTSSRLPERTFGLLANNARLLTLLPQFQIASDLLFSVLTRQLSDSETSFNAEEVPLPFWQAVRPTVPGYTGFARKDVAAVLDKYSPVWMRDRQHSISVVWGSKADSTQIDNLRDRCVEPPINTDTFLEQMNKTTLASDSDILYQDCVISSFLPVPKSNIKNVRIVTNENKNNLFFIIADPAVFGIGS